jgi:hypothetical protein
VRISFRYSNEHKPANTKRHLFAEALGMYRMRGSARCGSANVKTVFELIGQLCPRCKVGVIEEIETGAVV